MMFLEKPQSHRWSARFPNRLAAHAILLAVCVAMVGCAPGDPPRELPTRDKIAASPPKPKPPPKPPRPRDVYVDVQGRYPLQANLMITWGGCRAVADFSLQRRRDGRFILAVPTRPDPKCPGRGQPWEQIIPLDLTGLAAGVYEVEVNGLVTTFELPVDVPAAN